MKSMKRSYSNLPDEITFDILSRLPAKSVGLCRCVSKSWHSLLTQPDFIKTQLQIATSSGLESLLFFDPDRCFLYGSLRDAHHLFDKITLSLTKASFPDYSYPWSWVYASCNGLLLAEDSRGGKSVVNPVTREIRELPPWEYLLDDSLYIMYGIGYDSVHDDYKVVSISRYGFDPDDEDPDLIEIFVDVYSLKSGTWKRIECCPCDCYISEGLASGVYLGGFIHWMARDTEEDELAIMAFDLAHEKFVEVPPPDLMDGNMVMYFSIGVLDGCLCLFNGSDDYVWVMEEYGVQESWTMFPIDGPPGIGAIMLWGALGQGEVVFWRDEFKFVMYNVKGETLKDVEVHGTSPHLCPHAGVSFVESLISPHSWWW